MLLRALAAILLASLVPAPDSLDTVLTRAGTYVTAYRQDLGMVAADEYSVQIMSLWGSTHRDMMSTGAPIGEVSERKVRKMRAEVLLVANPGAPVWSAFRDVYEVDGKALRPEKTRLQRAFESSGGGGSEMQAMAKASLAMNLGTMNKSLTAPTHALLPLLPEVQKQFAFKKKGEKKVGDLAVWVVSYNQTPGSPALAMTADGTSQPIRGELWIDPASGRVVKTQIVFDTTEAYPDMKAHPERYREFPRSTMEVTFKLDGGLNAWVPAEATEFHDRQSEQTSITLTYSNFRRVTPK